MTRILTTKAKVWSAEGITREKFKLDDDGTVRVYDPIAGYYTTCHSMSNAEQARIRQKFAERKQNA